RSRLSLRWADQSRGVSANRIGSGCARGAGWQVLLLQARIVHEVPIVVVVLAVDFLDGFRLVRAGDPDDRSPTKLRTSRAGSCGKPGCAGRIRTLASNDRCAGGALSRSRLWLANGARRARGNARSARVGSRNAGIASGLNHWLPRSIQSLVQNVELDLARMQKPPLTFSGERIFVPFAQETHVVGIFELFHIHRISSKFAKIFLDRILVFGAAMDQLFLFFTLDLLRYPWRLHCQGNQH